MVDADYKGNCIFDENSHQYKDKLRFKAFSGSDKLELTIESLQKDAQINQVKTQIQYLGEDGQLPIPELFVKGDEVDAKRV